MMNVFPPQSIPDESVAGLFDKYADRFDEHLTKNLDYRVPEELVSAVVKLWNGSPLDVLDLGCGTGLCGTLIRPIANTLVGVDLSPGMIEMARKREIYDHLEVGNIIDSMRLSKSQYDLLLCADVLVYVGDCAPVFESAIRIMRPGAMLAFTVEAGAGQRFELVARTRRFTHSRTYIERLAKIFGLEELFSTEIMARKERNKPVKGYLTILRRPQE
jgi:predicted TPR repeat methyltransferase